jgi:hypothetical protein
MNIQFLLSSFLQVVQIRVTETKYLYPKDLEQTFPIRPVFVPALELRFLLESARV